MPGFPPPHDDEKEQLLAFLEQQRHLLRLASYGLTDEQARLAPSASSLSVGGLIKHLTAVEENWCRMIQREARPPDAERSYDEGFGLGPGETLAEAIRTYEISAKATDELVRSLALETPVPVPPGVPWFPTDVDAWTVRWVVLHLIEETARHAGHADIVRESVDGATWAPLLSAAEDWDLRPYVEPWQPPLTGAGPSAA